jgi:hypothetical protein
MTTDARRTPRPRGRRFWYGLLAVAAVALASASTIQSNGWNQSSHYALVKSLAAGTAVIDPYRLWTGDRARFEGHWYSSRAPGLALVSLPAYVMAGSPGAPYEAGRVGRLGGEITNVWLLTLWAAILPAAAIMLLVRHLGERLEPGLGAASAVALGAGTLLLPFSTLFFSHVLSAALAFAAFAVLWREREGPPRLALLALAGALVGFGVAAEYPIALAGLVLGLYAVARPASAPGRAARLATVVRRGLALSAGVFVGVIPLLAYNAWAFGSPTHLAYSNLKEHQTGLFGVHLPSPSVMVELLASSRGLVTLSPILVLAAVGLVLLYRRGRRAEALSMAAIALAFLVYNGGYWLPFGGRVPGPRFLISAIPFLGVPLVVAFRRLPGPALGLAIVSVVAMGAATLTRPMIENDADVGAWAAALGAANFQRTILSGVASGWVTAAPFVLLLGTALVLAAAAARGRLVVSGRQAALGAAAVVAWAALAVVVPRVLGIDASAGARIVAAGGTDAPVVDRGPFPLLELAVLAVVVALAGLALALAFLRAPSGRSAREATSLVAPAPPERTAPARPATGTAISPLETSAREGDGLSVRNFEGTDRL